MKKKVIFAVATGLFALATVFNMNVLQSNNAGDVSLDAIAVVAQAGSENAGSENAGSICQKYCWSAPGFYCLLETPTQYIYCFDRLPR